MGLNGSNPSFAFCRWWSSWWTEAVQRETGAVFQCGVVCSRARMFAEDLFPLCSPKISAESFCFI